MPPSGLKDTNGSCQKQTCHNPVSYVAPPKERKRPRGEEHPNSKLTENDVREIRRKHGEGVPKTRLAIDYGVSVMTIKGIIRRTMWAWLQ